MKRTVFIVGAGEYQVPLIEIAKRIGLNVITSDRNPEALGFKLADKSFAVDIKDREENLTMRWISISPHSWSNRWTSSR